MARRKAARPANHKVRKPRASVSSATSRRRKATSTTGLTQRPARQKSCQQLRPRTAEQIANEQTAEQLASRIWAAMVGEKILKDVSALMDELLQSHLLDDDDEEGDEGWLDDQHKREKKSLDEAIADGLDKYPDINAINNLPVNSDPDIAQAAKQLKDLLKKCAVGATEFKDRFSRAQLERLVKRDLDARFKKDPKYSQHVRNDVPGSDVKEYGSRSRTSSKGTFVKTLDYLGGGGLDTLLDQQPPRTSRRCGSRCAPRRAGSRRRARCRHIRCREATLARVAPLAKTPETSEANRRARRTLPGYRLRY
jgi:hypothetical protein